MRLAIVLLALLAAGCATVAPRGQPPHPRAGIAFDREHETAGFAEGVADPLTGRQLTLDDPVRVASISKLVATIGVMQLVEAGRLDLDRDVAHYLGWRLRNPAFPERPVTLRMLLSHTSSVRDHDDQYVVPLGATVAAAMADPKSWDPANPPGTNHFTYSNMNFPIVGSIVERVTGERFDLWMRRHVLEPMKLDACFNWPTCSDGAVARAVVLMQNGKAVRDELAGKRPDCPVFVKDGDACDLARWRPGENGALFSPQGGLRISARGLARIGRMLLNGGSLEGVRILTPRSVEAMMAPTWRFDGANGNTEKGFYCGFGLATQLIPTATPGCADDPGTRGATLAGHAGDAYGLKAGLWIDRERGRGLVYFVTGVPDDAPRDRRSAFTAAEAEAFRRTYALLSR